MKSEELRNLRNKDTGQFPTYAWPGGYPVYYLCADSGVLCPKCVNDASNPVSIDIDYPDDQWRIVEYGINWEDSELYCDHCNERIESAYAEDEPKENDNGN